MSERWWSEKTWQASRYSGTGGSVICARSCSRSPGPHIPPATPPYVHSLGSVLKHQVIYNGALIICRCRKPSKAPDMFLTDHRVGKDKGSAEAIDIQATYGAAEGYRYSKAAEKSNGPATRSPLTPLIGSDNPLMGCDYSKERKNLPAYV